MKNYKGFTLAEIIITMTIIGIIAAVTIPALLVSTNEKTMEAQKKALRARMAQTISQIEDLRSYAKANDDGDDDESAINFINQALKKVYRIKRVCKYDVLATSCDFPTTILTQNGVSPFNINSNQTLSAFTGTSFEFDTQVAGFTTVNGESIVVYYNPKCFGSKTNGFYGGAATSSMCLNMIYDINGQKEAPNEVGKDVGFITVFYPKDPDAILPLSSDKDIDGTYTTYEDAIAACEDKNKSFILPNWEDGMSMALNKKLTGMEDSEYLVTGAGSTNVYKVDVGSLTPSAAGSEALKLRCVYNN